ncbi:uncharacterized protein LOC111371907 [Olea europaea var. sylvestris]|uniref:uncharacterized protein LOC111371907 n=1 Tax=Olea europaea var. sylvestris TaxID=158386 RepID=UPI000C1D4D62|nr:uncharacterized protein LOC111371907 [Olea europaea var. sylvestris]
MQQQIFQSQHVSNLDSFPSTATFASKMIEKEDEDMYVKIEIARLEYFRNNQKKKNCAELYQAIVDCVENEEMREYKIGRKFVLPQSFICRPRDLLRKYMDAMSIVQRYGKSDIFFTMTEIAKVHALQDIGGLLKSLGININDYEIVPFNVNIDEMKD